MLPSSSRVAGGPGRGRRHLVSLVSLLLGTTAGVPVASLVVTDFRLDGPVERQLLGAVAIAGLVTVLVWPVLLGAGLVIRWARCRAVSGLDRATSRSRWLTLNLVAIVVGPVLVAMVLIGYDPPALWAAARVVGSLGLPVQLAGGWPTVVAAWVVLAVAAVVRLPLSWATGPLRLRRAVADLVEVGAVVTGFWFAESLLGDVTVVPDPGAYPGVLTLVVLAAMFLTFDVQPGPPFLTGVLTVAVGALKLWLVSWASTFFDVGLRISGFWTFLFAAVLVVGLTLLGRLIRQLLLGVPEDEPEDEYRAISG